MQFRVRTLYRLFSKIEHKGSKQNQTLHKGSNVACYAVVNFKTFLVYIYKLQTDQFSKMITWFIVRIKHHIFFEI